MLEVRSTGFFATEYVAEENGEAVGNLTRPWWSDWGEISISGLTLRVKRKQLLKAAFTLENAGNWLAELRRVTTSGFLLEHGGRNYRIRRKAWYSNVLIVESQGHSIGIIQPRGLFSRGLVADLSHELPLSVRVFLAWIFLTNQAVSPS